MLLSKTSTRTSSAGNRTNFPEIRAETCVMIGDSISDIEFGRRLGMYTIGILGPLGRRKPGWEQAMALADCSCCSLQEAVRLLFGSR